MSKLPPWVKGLTNLVGITLTIDSINSVILNAKGALVSKPLTYDSQSNRWQLSVDSTNVPPLQVQFTVKNNGVGQINQHGNVGGQVDQVSLPQFPVSDLAPGASISGSISFPPTNTLGDHIVTIAYRVGVEPPIPGSVVLAVASAVCFVYIPIH